MAAFRYQLDLGGLVLDFEGKQVPFSDTNNEPLSFRRGFAFFLGAFHTRDPEKALTAYGLSRHIAKESKQHVHLSQQEYDLLIEAVAAANSQAIVSGQLIERIKKAVPSSYA